MPSKKIKLGITGGIGSGKSYVCEIFRSMGMPVYDSDSMAKKLMNSSDKIRTAITNTWGDKIYNNGSLDKQKLADIIFNDKNALKTINSIVHPVVTDDFEEWAKQQNSNIVINESAIIFEAGLEKYFDAIISITAPKEIRIARVLKRDNTNREQVISRINNQWHDDKIKERSDFIICNDSSAPLLPQIISIIEKIKTPNKR